MDSFMHVLVTFLVAIPLMVLIYIPFIPAIIEAAWDGETVQMEPNFDFPILSMVAYGLMMFVLFIKLITSWLIISGWKGISIALIFNFPR